MNSEQNSKNFVVSRRHYCCHSSSAANNLLCQRHSYNTARSTWTECSVDCRHRALRGLLPAPTAGLFSVAWRLCQLSDSMASLCVYRCGQDSTQCCRWSDDTEIIITWHARTHRAIELHHSHQLSVIITIINNVIKTHLTTKRNLAIANMSRSASYKRQEHNAITRSFPCPLGSHQPSSNRLAPPERPTTSNLAPYHRVWPATDQPWPQLGVASRTRSFQMAFSCGDGYAHRWACHLMMMMMNTTPLSLKSLARTDPYTNWKAQLSRDTKCCKTFCKVPQDHAKLHSWVRRVKVPIGISL